MSLFPAIQEISSGRALSCLLSHLLLAFRLEFDHESPVPLAHSANTPTASRGKVVRLSQRGLIAQQAYHRLILDIEKRWEQPFGIDRVITLRESLQRLFDGLPEGLVPPEATAAALSGVGHEPRVRALTPASRVRHKSERTCLLGGADAHVRGRPLGRPRLLLC